MEGRNQVIKDNMYLKKSGTSGIKGQLYETKLLSLILHRLLKDDNIEQFVLGTNLEGLGAMDDIVLRYKQKCSRKSKIIFIQAKHRDDLSRNKLTIEEIKKEGDFSFQKYYESYLQIKDILKTNTTNLMFQGPKEDIELEFVIYTPIKENIPENKLCKTADIDKIIETNQSVFQLQCDDQDVDELMPGVRKSRARLLAKKLASFIKKDNYKTMMEDCLIKEYHVFLSEYVIMIEKEIILKSYDPSHENSTSHSSTDEEDSYYLCKFRRSFVNSIDEIFLLMKRVLLKELTKCTSISGQQEKNMLAKTFKLPIDFGNRTFRFNGNQKKRQRRLTHMCFIFDKLLQNANEQTFEIKIDSDSMGSGKIIERSWFGKHWIGGLVGNLLIYDIETETLKFNLRQESLSTDNINILSTLRESYDLSKFRFSIDIEGFPKFSLLDTKYDREVVRQFLGKLTFYTNQAQEAEVEEIIKNEIKSYYKHIPHTLFHIRCDVIFLKVHDIIQKWWKGALSTSYLTETCNFYEQAATRILDTPFIDFCHFIFKKELENIFIEFDSEAINSLNLDTFFKNKEKVLILVSNEVQFSCRKLIQYFETITNQMDCIFLHIDSIVVKKSIDDLNRELKLAKHPLLVLVSQDENEVSSLFKIIKQIIAGFTGQIIVVTYSSFEQCLRTKFPKYIIQKDNHNKFSDLCTNIRNRILNSQITFQGLKVTVSTVFNNVSLDLLSAKLLRQLICKEHIELGQPLGNKGYYKIKDYYVDRNLFRYITMNVKEHKDKFWCLDDEQIEKYELQNINDILIITESESVFKDTCDRYNKSNVHWFLKKEDDKDVIWKKTRGSLESIVKFGKNDFTHDHKLHKDFMLKIETLYDVPEKVVIISSEPGMGKSTLLTHLAIKTKQSHPNLWIININLLENINRLIRWEFEQKNINLIEAIKFLCSCSISTKNYMSDDDFEGILKLIHISGDQIGFKESDIVKLNLEGVDLSELKLFIHFYNNNNLAVLIDGFDEICPDYTKEITQLLCVLKMSKISHLWITSRPCNTLKYLELALETLSFSLCSLSKTEQKSVLHKIWSNKIPNTHQTDVDHFYDFWINHGRVLETFTSLPLHLYMIAEVFEDYYVAYILMSTRHCTFNDATNLVSLYQKFTRIKFLKERFSKQDQKNLKMRKIIQREFNLYYENHKKVAAYFLLDRDLVLSDHDIKTVRDFLNNLRLGDEKSDIIVSIIDNHPKFVHYTFAEYYAVEHVFDKLISLDISCTAYFLNDLLINDKFVGIRRFINCKLERNQDIVFYLQSIPSFRNIVFNTISIQNDTLTKTALYANLEENLEVTVNFLIESVDSFVNEDNLSLFLKTIQSRQDCLVCYAFKNGKERTVHNIMKLVVEIDTNEVANLFSCLIDMKRKSYLLFKWMESVVYLALKKEIYDTDLLFAILTSYYKFELKTPAHSLGTDLFEIKHLWDCIALMNSQQLFEIFSVTDNEGQTPVHYAAMVNNYSFFTRIYDLLGKEKFKEICLMRDNLDFTTVCLFPFDDCYFNELKILLEIVFDETDVDVQDFVYNKLPKLYPKYIAHYWSYFLKFEHPYVLCYLSPKWGRIGLNSDTWVYEYTLKSGKPPIGVHAIIPFLKSLRQGPTCTYIIG